MDELARLAHGYFLKTKTSRLASSLGPQGRAALKVVPQSNKGPALANRATDLCKGEAPCLIFKSVDLARRALAGNVIVRVAATCVCNAAYRMPWVLIAAAFMLLYRHLIESPMERLLVHRR